ncbi:hypothetical protein Nepgr_000803 [Nepenthes gracilis]|uniref:BZIP domain-containing protein n=1 Tax=Nepenthes gracilis TaxID=150966 RepID=A0AAD3P3F8_NEPGR|nr:hypothetical protein Nepgr_000803 [Nepenthes gracilis]
MKDEWFLAAMTDDSVVAELLLGLKQSDSDPSRPKRPPSPFQPLDWGLRQPRSKAMPSKRGLHPTRRSPTTPLSWSAGGGASHSDGYEESSGPYARFPTVRSKNVGTNNIVVAALRKRMKRKKTFAELKEEESSLLKERSFLKRELATLRVTLKEQRSVNETLKRMKIDFCVESETTKSGEMLNETDVSTLEAAPSNVPKHIACNDDQDSEADRSSTIEQHAIFALPDLNMIPEEELGPETLVGTS